MTALDAVDSSKAVPSSRTPTRPPRSPTLSQYFVEIPLHQMTKYHIMEYIVHGWCERAEDEEATRCDSQRASEESA